MQGLGQALEANSKEAQLQNYLDAATNKSDMKSGAVAAALDSYKNKSGFYQQNDQFKDTLSRALQYYSQISAYKSMFGSANGLAGLAMLNGPQAALQYNQDLKSLMPDAIVKSGGIRAAPEYLQPEPPTVNSKGIPQANIVNKRTGKVTSTPFQGGPGQFTLPGYSNHPFMDQISNYMFGQPNSVPLPSVNQNAPWR
jgi:hypothetical protein